MSMSDLSFICNIMNGLPGRQRKRSSPKIRLMIGVEDELRKLRTMPVTVCHSQEANTCIQLWDRRERKLKTLVTLHIFY